MGGTCKFDFVPQTHWEIVKLDILDPSTASKVTGARFMFYKSWCTLRKGINEFMLDYILTNMDMKSISHSWFIDTVW